MTSHRNPKRRRLSAAAAVLSAVIALTGCTSAVVQQSTESDTESTTPVRGGTLSIAVSPDAQPNAVLGGYNGNWPWLSNVFETLVSLDPETRAPEPLLATEWVLADDGLSMDITLRDDVTFHTGRPMTADDVKFSFEKALDPAAASQLAFIAKQFTSIDVNSDTELSISFARPLSNVFDFFGQTSIADAETYDGLLDGTQVIGTGAYTFADWNPGASYTLERYEDYRDKDAAYLDTIQYDVILDSTALVSAVRSGRDQIGYGMSTTDTQGFAGNAQFTIANGGGGIYPFGLDVTVAPFDDKEVRQAVMFAIDGERINQQVFQGTGTVTDLFWAPQEPGYSEELAGTYAYDPDLAREMLEEAGVVGTEITIAYMSTPLVDSIFQIVANNLEEAGFVVSADVLDSPTFIQRQIDGDLGAVFLSLHGQVGRGAATLIESLPTLRKGNPSQFWSPEYEALRADLAGAANAEESAAAVEALSAYMVDEAFVRNIVQAPKQVVISNAVQGLEMGTSGELRAKYAYLTE